METTTEILNQLKEHFVAGAQPTEAHFSQLIETFLVNHQNKVGIGTELPRNTLDVNGSVAIGNGHAGAESAPANGLIVEGNVGIGHNIADESLHVKGNVKIENGNLYVGQHLVINSDGEWEGAPIDGGNNTPVQGPWSEANNALSTNRPVGLGTDQPDSPLHVVGDTTIENGDLNLQGVLHRKSVAFTAFGFESVSALFRKVLLSDHVPQQNNQDFWDSETSTFTPDADHAGTYCFMASIQLKASNDNNTDDGEAKEIYFATSDADDNGMSHTKVLPILNLKNSTQGSASLMLYLDGSKSVGIYTSDSSIDIDSITFSGYRI